jgi:hypothetical protein
MIVDKILQFIGPNTDKVLIDELLYEFRDEISYAITRQLFRKREEKASLRLSGIGKCLRGQAYTMHGHKPNQPAPQAKMKFLYGDIVEALVVILAKHAGVLLSDEQKEVHLEDVMGHIDGIVLHDDIKYLFECKSMSEQSFKRFVQVGMSDDPFGYVSQANSYAYALGLDHIVWVGVCKSTGKMHEEIRKVDTDLAKRTIENIRRLKSCRNPTQFDRFPAKEETFGRKTKKNGMDNRTGNILLDTGCGYCNHNRTCWGSEVTLFLRGKTFKHYVGDIVHGEWTAGGRIIND